MQNLPAPLNNVSRETLSRLEIYAALLQEWSPRLSLVGRATLTDAWQRHFVDSAQLLPLLNPQAPLLDMGTGAGFPGMVLAILGAKQVHLAENNQKKVDFLREVAARTATTVTIHNVKVEALPALPIATLVSRALAPLDQLLALGERFFRTGATGIFLKGKQAAAEIEAARAHWRFTVSSTPSLTSAEASILRVSDVRRP